MSAALSPSDAGQAGTPAETFVQSRPTSAWRGSRATLILIILAGAFARLLTLTIPAFEDPYSWRQYDTAAIARNFAEGQFHILYPQIDWRGNSPGYVESEFQIYTATVAALYRLFGVHEWLGGAVNIAAYAAGALLLFALVRRLFGEREAHFAVFFYAVLPLSFLYTRTFQPDAFLSLASLVGVYYFWRWTEEGGGARLAASALGICVAILIKPFSAYLGLVALWLAFRKIGWAMFRNFYLWMFAAVTLLPPVLWYTHAARLWYAYGNTFGVIAGPPGLWVPPAANLGPWTAAKVIAWQILALLLTPAGIILLVAGWVWKPRGNYGPLAAWAVAFGAVVLVAPTRFQYHEYYLLPMVFVAAAGMGVGLCALLETRALRPWFARGVVVFLLVWLTASAGFTTAGRLFLFPRHDEVRSFDARVQQLTEPGALVIFLRQCSPEESYYHRQHRTAQGEFLSSFPRDFYLSHRKGFSLDAELATPAFIETLRQRGARYLATPWVQLIADNPALARELARRYTPLVVAPEGVLYRLDSPALAGVPSASNPQTDPH
jgi:4-amino-4-deoxy-L-arabinose transferase-like glycosyltransferase